MACRVVAEFPEREVKSSHPLRVLVFPLKQLQQVLAEVLYRPRILKSSNFQQLVEERLTLILTGFWDIPASGS